MATSPTLTLNNGVEIPQLGFGVYKITGDAVVPAVSHALEVGYRHVDTATLYGNEDGVGRAVRASGIAREDLFVTTKLWNDDHGRDRALRALDTSLTALGLDHVDLFLIHWPQPSRDLYVETWQALEEALADGRVRALGVSNFQPDHLGRLQRETATMPAVNQVELHPSFAQTELAAVNRELGIVTEAWAPLGRAGDFDNDTVRGIAERLGRTPAQVVLRWHLQLGHVAIPKSATPERIASNFAVFDFELSAADMAAVGGLDAGNRIGLHPDR